MARTYTAACARYHALASEGLKQKVLDCEQGKPGSVRYGNAENTGFENSFQDILLHAFNHGTYHRAQIAQEMRIHGLEPINTDYITFVRKR